MLAATQLLSTLPTNAQTPLTAQSKLAINGINSVRVGMTITEAEKATGQRLLSPYNYEDDFCYYRQARGGPQGLNFMIIEGQIARIDVFGQSEITTISGAKIGDTEEKIKSLYGDKIKVSPHPYIKGHYLTYVPRSVEDSNYRVIFETNERGRVISFRSGRLPEVSWIEGCS